MNSTSWALQVVELVQPRLPVGVGDGDVVHAHSPGLHRPAVGLGRRGRVDHLDQGQVVVVGAVAPVEAHGHGVAEVAALLEPEELGVEAV